MPFLPLEHEHVRGCVQQQLRALLERDPYEYVFSEENVVDDVLNLIEFASPSSSTTKFSVSGCKKIAQKLDYVFERLRPKLKKTKKQPMESDDIL